MGHRLIAGLNLFLLLGEIHAIHAQVNPQATVTTASTAAPAAGTITVLSGTKIPLVLKNEVNTRSAQPGDPVYLVSDFPVVQNGEVVLPAGMYVKGVIDSIQRAGKVKGRAQLQMHFVSLILPNGKEVSLTGALQQVPASAGSNVVNSEGTVQRDSTVGKDTQKVATTTLEGVGVGGIVGYAADDVAKGTAIGAGAGAAVGIIATLFTRGPDVVIPSGAGLQMTLTRTLVIPPQQLSGMPASTGMVPSTPQALPLSPRPAN
jgi:type IV secretion system protein VirB10